jgi:hypothetical protein
VCDEEIAGCPQIGAKLAAYSNRVRKAEGKAHADAPANGGACWCRCGLSPGPAPARSSTASDHREVQRRLGGRLWIHRALRLINEGPGSTCRGKIVLCSYGWIAHDRSGAPVAFISGDVMTAGALPQ